MKNLLKMTVFMVLSTSFCSAQNFTTVDADWISSSALVNFSGTALTAGTAASGDGAVLQIGYYSSATTTFNFGTAGGTDWVALTGNGGLNSGLSTTSVGDGGTTAGHFTFSSVFTSGSATTGVSLPASTTIPLAIRFYDGTTVAGSTRYNVVSADNWLWSAPSASPGGNVFLSDLDTLEWFGGAGSAFKTTVSLAAVPEPATCSLLGLGVLGLIFRKRK